MVCGVATEAIRSYFHSNRLYIENIIIIIIDAFRWAFAYLTEHFILEQASGI